MFIGAPSRKYWKAGFKRLFSSFLLPNMFYGCFMESQLCFMEVRLRDVELGSIS